MNKPSPLLLAIGAALLQPAFYAHAETVAEETSSPPGSGISEISDDELASMRGRYTVGDNTVAWFGVSMISTWQNQAGQVLESTMTVAMDFRHGGNSPKVSFTPTVNITAANAPLPKSAAEAVQTAVASAPQPQPQQDPQVQQQALAQQQPQSQPQVADATQPQTTATPAAEPTPAAAAAPAQVAQNQPQRSTDASGLQNVSGLVQSVQVAGDRNVASNATQLNVRNGAVPEAAGSAASGGTLSTTNGAASATSSYANGTAGVLLAIAGQGEVQQWIRNGSVGQSIQLTGDAQQVSNRLQLDLIRQSLSDNAPLTQNVAQAITLARGMGPMGQ